MKPTTKKKTTAIGRIMAKELRSAMPFVNESGSDSTQHFTRSKFTCTVLQWHDCSCETLEFYQGVFELWNGDRVFCGENAYGRRIMALELAALLAEDGFTAEDFQ